jgi:multisubunit Na+/H+ antiporter MnhB subunit
MSDSFVLGGVVLGLFLLIAYVAKARRKANLVDAISLILSGVGLLTGLKVCWLSVADREINPFRDISTQVFIGGVAICWVAIQNGVKKFYD